MSERKRHPFRAPAVDATTLKAFAHPLRMRMYDYLKDHGAATASMLAQAMGENTGQTSYHLRQLERHGLIEEETGRGSARERWWRTVGFSFSTRSLAQDTAAKTAAQAVMHHQLQTRNDRLTEWIDRMGTEDREWVEVSTWNEVTAMLTVEEVEGLAHAIGEAMVEHLDRAKAARAADGEAGARMVKMYQLTFPLPPEEPTGP